MKKDVPFAIEAGAKRVLLLGLPNTGKTQVFNNLTGEYGIVANYPMTTIETRSAGMVTSGRRYTVTDTPGLHGLFIHSEEEILVRDYIVRETPDVIIQCIDANRLKLSLFLTAELMELQLPLVISLNDIDETERRGKAVDAKKLSSLLGVPVIESVATQGRGTQELKKALEDATVSKCRPVYPSQLLKSLETIAAALPEKISYPGAAALLILQQDPYILSGKTWIRDEDDRKSLAALTAHLKLMYHGSVNRVIGQRRNVWVDKVEKSVVVKNGAQPNTTLEKLASLTRRPLAGIPIVLAVLAGSYFAVVHGAGSLSALLVRFIQDPIVGLMDRFMGPGLIKDFLIGHYGILTLGLFNAICTVLPILSVFFIIFGLLEDIGYLPNLAILVNKVLSRIGLSGKSLMSLVLGFGCKTMAILTSKSISYRKERLIAVFLIAFGIPCSAQLGMNIAILGNSGILSFFIVLLFLSLVEFGAGAVLNKLIKEDKKSSFIQELPAFRIPNVIGLLKKTGHRLIWFLKDSLFIFIIAAAVIFIIDKLGVLGAIKTVMHPLVVRWLGLPIDMVDPIILILARQEMAAGLILGLSNAGKLSMVQSMVAVATTTMFIPCMASIAAIFKENGFKAALAIILSINISTYILAGAFNLILGLIFGRT